MKKWYEEHYENSALTYEKEVFIQGTKEEVDFLEGELSFDKNAKILDVGCGTGRHSLELARRGYSNVSGIDLSQSLIGFARKMALKENLKVNFDIKDACKLNFDKEFDFAMIMCEGGFSLVESDEKDAEILRGIYNALTEEGKLVMTAPSAIYQIKHGDENAFDLTTFRETFELESKDDHGNVRNLKCNQRYYTPTELKSILLDLGFRKIEVLGGNFNKDEKITADMFEFMVIAEK